MGYILLGISIIFEVIATNLLKVSEGMTIVWAIFASLACYGVSFFFLGLTLKTIPLSIAYAIWAGAGTVIMATVSIVLWGEVFSVMKGIAFIVIIAGIVLLNLSEKSQEK